MTTMQLIVTGDEAAHALDVVASAINGLAIAYDNAIDLADSNLRASIDTLRDYAATIRTEFIAGAPR